MTNSYKAYIVVIIQALLLMAIGGVVEGLKQSGHLDVTDLLEKINCEIL